MEDKTKIWSMFDFKAACLFTGYKNREAALMKELERVGLGDAKIMWQFPTPFDAVMRRNVKGKAALRTGFFNSGMGHYRAIKTAYELGAKRSLIMEDDVRFLKDLELASKIVRDLPDDFDVALLDVLKPQKMPISECLENRRKNMVSSFWCRFFNMRSFACYAMSRRGMERWICLWEGAFKPGGFLRIGDQYMNRDMFGHDMNMYHAVPNVAIQNPVGTSNSGQQGWCNGFYRDFGIDINSYAIG